MYETKDKKMHTLHKIIIAIPAFLLMGVGCTLPGASPVPPAGDPTAFDLILLNADGEEMKELTKRHTVSKDSCPDKLPAFTINVPEGGEVKGPGVAKTETKWLLLPDQVKIGEPVELKFNCDIDDLSPHTEEGEVIFEFGDSSSEPESSPSQEYGIDSRRSVDVKLKVKMEICNVGQLCGPSLES